MNICQGQVSTAPALLRTSARVEMFWTFCRRVIELLPELVSKHGRTFLLEGTFSKCQTDAAFENGNSDKKRQRKKVEWNSQTKLMIYTLFYSDFYKHTDHNQSITLIMAFQSKKRLRSQKKPSECRGALEEKAGQSRSFWRNKHLLWHQILLWSGAGVELRVYFLLGLKSRIISTLTSQPVCNSQPQRGRPPFSGVMYCNIN